MESQGFIVDKHKGMNLAILIQCFGALRITAFTNGLLLVYLTVQNIASSRIIIYLSIPSFIETTLLVLSAHFGDRRGRKKIGSFGLFLDFVGFVFIVLSSFWPSPQAEVWLLVGTLILGIGSSFFSSTWFALVDPLVPKNQRGRFWGRLRFSWQIVAILGSAGCAVLLSQNASIQNYRLLFFFIALLLFIRAFLYLWLPEVNPVNMSNLSLLSSLSKNLRREGCAPFCAYVFLLMLFTSSSLMIFGLIEKKVLVWSDSMVVMMGSITMIGSVFGYLLGGKIVDTWGTKTVFLFCHFGYGASLFLFLARDLFPISLFGSLGLVHLLFGLISAASSIAITSEMLALAPPESASLSTSLCQTMLYAGEAASGFLASWTLSIGMLSPTWSLGRLLLTNYDSLLFGFGIMIVLLVVTLGLVPSVLQKSEWTPRD